MLYRLYPNIFTIDHFTALVALARSVCIEIQSPLRKGKDHPKFIVEVYVSLNIIVFIKDIFLCGMIMHFKQHKS